MLEVQLKGSRLRCIRGFLEGGVFDIAGGLYLMRFFRVRSMLFLQQKYTTATTLPRVTTHVTRGPNP